MMRLAARSIGLPLAAASLLTATLATAGASHAAKQVAVRPILYKVTAMHGLFTATVKGTLPAGGGCTLKYRDEYTFVPSSASFDGRLAYDAQQGWRGEVKAPGTLHQTWGGTCAGGKPGCEWEDTEPDHGPSLGIGTSSAPKGKIAAVFGIYDLGGGQTSCPFLAVGSYQDFVELFSTTKENPIGIFSGETIALSLHKTLPASYNLGIYKGKGTAAVDVRLTLRREKRKKLRAVPRVSGPQTRVATRTLDGSRSKGKIRSYEWAFEALECGDVKTKPGAKKSGKTVTIKPLCTIKATLTVSDGRDEDSASVAVKVTPRKKGRTTPFAHRNIDGGAGAPTDPPRSSCAGSCAVAIDGGINLPDCPGTAAAGSAILCPLLSGRPSWLGSGYKLATVADRGGPFAGYSYVNSSTIEVRRKGLVNPSLLPGGAKERDGNNFYGFNKAKGANVDGFLNAIRQHEGMGAGKPRTGHSQIMKADLPNDDPRRWIEKLFGPSATSVQRQVDGKLKEIDTRIDGDSADPLPDIWRGELWFWDDYVRVWRAGEISVPGNGGG